MYATLHCLDGATELFPSEKTIDALRFTCRHFGYDLDKLPISVEIDNLPFGGMMNMISNEDIRIALKKRDGHSGYSVALHEMGHALYEYFSFGQPPELVRFRNIIGTEAMAEIFMTIASQKEWLVDCMGMEGELLNQMQEAEHLMSLMLTKYYYYMSLVENAIYEEPDVDFQETADRLFEEVFGLKGKTMNPAMEILFVIYPAYVQDYIYADGVRDMIRKSFGIKGLYQNQNVFEAIRTIYMEPSESKTWQEKVKELCGEPFTFAYFKQFLSKKTVMM